MNDLIDKVAIVTGGGGGLGEAISHRLAGNGVKVALAVRSQGNGERVAQAIRSAGGNAIAIECDVSNISNVDALLRRVLQRFHRVDILINNAGSIDPIASIDQSDTVAWRKSIDVNLLGAYLCARQVLPEMLRVGAGTIISLSSGAAHKPIKGWSAYCAAKAGLAMLTQSIALEYGPSGIRAIGFAPGVVDTPMQAKIRASGSNPHSHLPRENLTDPDGPAAAIVWLCGPGGVFWHGREVDVRDPEFVRAMEAMQPGGL